MEKVNQSQVTKTVVAPTNPFCPIPKELAPVPEVTDYHKDGDKYIIEYEEVEEVEMTGEKKTDFVINKKVVETGRTDRQKYLDSNANEVGILNIIKKVQMSGDTTLLNQTGRVSVGGIEKDALGRPVEDVVDVTNYQVGTVEALESYKNGSNAFKDIDPNLKGKMSFEEMAKMSDADIDVYLNNQMAAIKAQLAASKAKEEKGE